MSARSVHVRQVSDTNPLSREEDDNNNNSEAHEHAAPITTANPKTTTTPTTTAIHSDDNTGPVSPSLDSDNTGGGSGGGGGSDDVTSQLSSKLRQTITRVSYARQMINRVPSSGSEGKGMGGGSTSPTPNSPAGGAPGGSDRGDGEEEKRSPVEVGQDSASSATLSPQFRRNNPYATSPAQPFYLDDASSSSYVAGASAGTAGGGSASAMNSPQVTVMMHTGSNRVSRTTSMVKAGEARVSRTTSMITTSDTRVSRTTSLVKTSTTPSGVSTTTTTNTNNNNNNGEGGNATMMSAAAGGSSTTTPYAPQLPHFTAGMPGSAKVSRTTSMVKGNESIVFPMPPLRFAPSQTSSARVSRTTSMVKSVHNGGNNDSIPILFSSQQQQQQQQPPGSAVSPLLKMSPQSSQSNLFGTPHFSPGGVGESHYNPVHRRAASGSALQLTEGDAIDGGSTTSSSAYMHHHHLHFHAGNCNTTMPHYHSGELGGVHDSTEFIGEDGEENGLGYEEEEEVVMRSPGNPPSQSALPTHHHHHYHHQHTNSGSHNHSGFLAQQPQRVSRQSSMQRSSSDRQPQTPGHNITYHRRTFDTASEEAGSGSGNNGGGGGTGGMPLYTPLSGYAGSSLPNTFSEMRSNSQQQQPQRIQRQNSQQHPQQQLSQQFPYPPPQPQYAQDSQQAENGVYVERSDGMHGSTPSFQTSSTSATPHANPISGDGGTTTFSGAQHTSSPPPPHLNPNADSSRRQQVVPPGGRTSSNFEAADVRSSVEDVERNHVYSSEENPFHSSQQQQQQYYPDNNRHGSNRNNATDNYADDVDDVVESAPNELMRTQPPRPPVNTTTTTTSGGSTAAQDAEATPRSTAHAPQEDVPGFTVAELTALLESAQRNAAAGDGDDGASVVEQWCPPGWQFSVYDAGMREHYVIPSEEVALTRGAIKYVALFDRYGNQTRFRFQLCNRYLRHRCSAGSECPYIHSHVLSKSTQVHVNENSITTPGVRQPSAEELAGGRNTLEYPTMPPGMVFAVYPPNQLNSAPQLIPSELILVTDGAQQTSRALAGYSAEQQQEQQRHTATLVQAASSHGSTPPAAAAPAAGGMSMSVDVAIVRPRHCAHFQFKRMCNLGASCHFIHSLIPFVQGMVNQPTLPLAAGYVPMEERSAGFVLPSAKDPAESATTTTTTTTAPAAVPNVAVPQPWPSVLPMAAATASAPPMNAMMAPTFPPGLAGSDGSSGVFHNSASGGNFNSAATFTPQQSAAAAAAAAAAGFGMMRQDFPPHLNAYGMMPTFAMPTQLAAPQRYADPQQYIYAQQQQQQQQGPYGAHGSAEYQYHSTHGSPHAYAAYGNAPMQTQGMPQQWASMDTGFYP